MSKVETALEQLFAQVEGYVARATAVHVKRIDELQAALNALQQLQLKEGPPGRDGIDGKDGAPGIDGKDGAPGINGERGAPGEKGLDGLNGKDGNDGAPGIPGDRGADGKDGRDGRDGKDGAPGRDASALDVLPAINPEKSYPAGTWACHAGGLWVAKTTTDGMAGWHCQVEGLASIEITGGDGRNFELKATMSSGKAVSLPFTVPTMLDRGVWREGEYEKGDTVTFGGSAFIAQRDTTDKPETSDAWRLAVKRGRDGRDAGSKK